MSMTQETSDTFDYAAALAALEWQVELGVDEAICETPIDRMQPAPAPIETAGGEGAGVDRAAAPALMQTTSADPVAEATALASTAQTLDELRKVMAEFDRCELKRGARNLVFSDGHPTARLMIIGEAPGRDEDREGRPYVGRAGQLLDRMLAAIGHDRTSDDPQTGAYITNTLPWRPPQNRDPKPDELAMMKPFLDRHVQLADPDVILLTGNYAMRSYFGASERITRARGQWREAAGRPAIATFHPAGLLRNPSNKTFAWADLLDLKARLRATE